MIYSNKNILQWYTLIEQSTLNATQANATVQIASKDEYTHTCLTKFL